MKLKALFAALAVAAILPVAALADPASASDKANGARSCQTAEDGADRRDVQGDYGTNADKRNAFGNCVSAWTKAEHQNRHAAETACKTEQADAAFATAHGGKTFAQFYGVGNKGANALNRCVQAKRIAESAADKQDVVAAAKTCKAERKSMGDVAFKAAYGTNADVERVRQVRSSKLASA